MSPGKVIILSGPSGSGKTTLYKKLLADSKDLVRSISVTTRSRRPGEKHGRDYIFVTRLEFEKKKKKNEFLEYQKVFDNYYGTPYSAVKNLIRSGKNVLLCIDVKGARVVRRKIKSAIGIFIKTPSLKILKSRLEARGSEDPQTLLLRYRRAKLELKEAKHYDHIIVNNNLSESFRRLKMIVQLVLEEK